MKKIISAVALTAFALFGLAACATEPTPTVTVTEPAPVPVELTAEEKFLQNLHQYDSNYVVANTPDSNLINLGYELCSILDQGATVEQIVNELAYGSFGREYGSDTDAIEFAGLVIGAAIRDLCPQYLYQVQ